MSDARDDMKPKDPAGRRSVVPDARGGEIAFWQHKAGRARAGTAA